MRGEQSGKKTYGLDYFFAGLQQKVIPDLSFFILLLVSGVARHPISIEQIIRSAEEKAAIRSKKVAKRAKWVEPKRKPGRPKGSKNKLKAEIELNPELARIKALLLLIRPVLQPVYLALDGHFGNYPAFQMVQQCGFQINSKLRYDATLCFPFHGEYKGSSPQPKHGERVDYQHIPDTYLISTTMEKGIQTCVYQVQLLHADFPDPLNVGILVKTNLTSHAWVYVLLFSGDLALSAQQMFTFSSLRFQLEFNFKDAKQFWGLEDFKTAVTNAANLSPFMVNVALLYCPSFVKPILIFVC